MSSFHIVTAFQRLFPVEAKRLKEAAIDEWFKQLWSSSPPKSPSMKVPRGRKATIGIEIIKKCPNLTWNELAAEVTKSLRKMGYNDATWRDTTLQKNPRVQAARNEARKSIKRSF
jgi:hypothetical protein